MSLKQTYCAVCDHEVVPGVACDGQPDECPYHVAHVEKQHQKSSFAATVDSMTGEKNTESVKAID